MEKALISACLLGVNCRYDGKNCYFEGLEDLMKEYCLIPVCPEVFGGLTTPRDKSAIVKGDFLPSSAEDVFEGKAKVISEKGVDVTRNFLRGAEETLKIAKIFGVKKAFLKSKSPSCGVQRVSCFGNVIKGIGISAFLLKQNGIETIEKN